MEFLTLFNVDNYTNKQANTIWSRLLMSLLFAIVFVIIPWESIKGRPFEDFEVYFNKFSTDISILEKIEPDRIIWYFTNEFIWDLFIRNTESLLGVSLENIFLFISFLTIFSFSLVILKYLPPFALLFLFNPLVVDFSMSQLRSAFATALLIISLLITRLNLLRVAIVVCTLFIHSVTILFVVLYAIASLYNFISTKMHIFSIKLFAITVGLLICLVIGPLREMILSSINDRRADYEVASSTIVYASFWLIFIFTILHQHKDYFYRFENFLAFVGSIIFVVGTLGGVPTVRFAAMTFPFMIVAAFQLKGHWLILIAPTGLVFWVMQWQYWLSL